MRKQREKAEETPTETADEKNTGENNKETQPAAPAPAESAAPEKEDLHSQLSKTDSLEQKLALVRSADMGVSEKVEILNKSLDLKEWNRLNGRYNTAKKEALRWQLWQSSMLATRSIGPWWHV